MSLAVLIFGTVAVIILSGFIVWADLNLKSAYRAGDRAMAFRISEAGIEYYRWHLAHNPDDFQDGTGQIGPYTHDFKDKNDDIIGQFILDITPPEDGSSVVTIKSTGKILNDPTIEKTIKVKMAKPSFVKFAAVVNAPVRFGEGTEVFGAIHSNGGIRFDGLAHNVVTSAVEQYNDPDHSGNVEFGVHTHTSPIDPTPPSAVPIRQDVFEAGREFPVPAVDFSGITSDLSNIKANAQVSGLYFGPSDDDGYHIVLKTNDTADIYKVTKIIKPPNGCTSVLGQQGWGTWTIETQQLLGNYLIPENGLLFFEDHIWVDGKIDEEKITIASAKFPENPANYTSITVNNDLLYTNYDGSDSIGLVAQGDFRIGWQSEDDLRIDAAIIAQNGWVGRQYYRPPSGGQNRCAPYHVRDTITIYGTIGSYQRYGFAYTNGTGYQIRNLIYDPNLLFSPPPDFPLTSDYYETISWSEVK